jgi:hypothetical protein
MTLQSKSYFGARLRNGEQGIMKEAAARIKSISFWKQPAGVFSQWKPAC